MKNTASAVVEQPAATKIAQLVESHRILIVDDEMGILDAYKDILNPKTNVTSIKSSRSKNAPPMNLATTPILNDLFELTMVPSGEEALAQVKKANKEGRPFAMGFFDVLLGDGIDGIETVKKIHETDPHMYAVLVTAYQDRHVDSINQIFGENFQDRWDYLNKPFTQGEIRQKARSMVSMWNLRKKEEMLRSYLEELKRHLSENEKMLMVAAVARNVGHEFGNILLQIMGRADLSKDGTQVEMKKALETILIATEHASKVLDRFKSLAKPTESSQNFSTFPIIEPLDETLSLMEHELRRRQIKIIKSISEPSLVFANKSSLVQVFMNLTINALHAMDDKGQIEFAGKVVNKNFELRVRDSGKGIPPENLDFIFSPFFTTKGDKGTGLGLAICKEIIEISHGGKLIAQNHLKGGAEFIISIPTSKEDQG